MNSASKSPRVEIERRYLVKGEFSPPARSRQEHYRQGYLSTDPERVVRMRAEGGKALLTIKGKKVNSIAPEFEYEIPQAHLDFMLNHMAKLVEKTRYFVRVDDHQWVVDVFCGENEGLVVAEIELGSIDEAFTKPSWVGDEITADFRYSNSNLAEAPFRAWLDSTH